MFVSAGINVAVWIAIGIVTIVLVIDLIRNGVGR